jgi:diguanylate cyclase (GGDEF)-like protein/PAS domain S-box-containing protein
MTKNIYRQALRPWLFGMAVALLGMVGSVFLARQQAQSAEQVEQARFALAANSVIEALVRRIDAYTEIAFGLRGLFIVNPALDRRSFVDAISHLDVDTRYPGIKNIAFTRYVTAAEKQLFEMRVRADTSVEPQGYPVFAIHPPGKRTEYFVADYLWPLNGNKGIHGLDISAQPANLASMHYSQRSGQPVASAPFNLLQETTHRTGFVIRVPVFRSSQNSLSTQAQASNFLGSVSVTLRVFDLVQQLEREGRLQGLQLDLSDRGSALDNTTVGVNLPLFSTPPVSSTHATRLSRDLSVYGRKWQLDFQPNRQFLSDAERRIPTLIGLAGGLISLLLGSLVFLLARGRSHALARAALSGEALKHSEERWRFALEGAGDGVWDLDIQTGEAFFSRRCSEILGYDESGIHADVREWEKRVHPQDLPDVVNAFQRKLDRLSASTAVEFRMQCKDGSWKWIQSRGMVLGMGANGKPMRLIGTITDITQRKAAEDEIRYLAFYDPLTQLPNRRLLHDRLQQALASSNRSARHSALLFIDLDNFKTLNDAQGHDKGDLLLQQVAQRLSASIREGDTVARLGGDEFVVILEDLSATAADAAAQAETVGEKIIAALNRPYDLAGLEHHSTPSMGVTLFSDQRESIDELLKRADLAMYQAKSAGRNTLRFFDPDMQAVVNARALLELNLREGLRGGQFLLYYQAQVDRGRVTGAEVLLRWQHPERGFVSPADFIPLAEDTGLILPLGQWVLTTACQQLFAWAADPLFAPLTLSVNVSSRQFRQPDFVNQVLTTLAAAGADPHKLKLELTESLLLDNVEGTIAKMSQLKAHGVGFSLDDFGTGYSSLAYLKRLPLDQLKIDQSFVRDVLTDPNDAAIAKTIIALAQSLGLGVMAEGVEIAAQRDFLAASGCHTYQGYFFSRPLPLEGFETFFRQA